MFTIKEFSEELAKHLKLEMPDKVFEIVNITKTNNVEKIGISIKSQDSSLVPVVHINDYYNDYIMERCNISMIIDHIKEGLNTCTENFKKHFPIENRFLDYEEIKTCIYPVLINTKENANFLETVINKPFLDLSIIYRLIIKQEDSVSSMIITHNILAKWNISEEEIEKVAFENLNKKETVMVSFLDTFNDIFPFNDMDEDKAYGMANTYMAKTDMEFYGSNILLNKKFFREITKEFGDNIYIIPSSINEIILMKESLLDLDKSEITNFISEVNHQSDVLPPDEVLSGSLYIYNVETDSIEIASEKNI